MTLWYLYLEHIWQGYQIPLQEALKDVVCILSLAISLSCRSSTLATLPAIQIKLRQQPTWQSNLFKSVSWILPKPTNRQFIFLFHRSICYLWYVCADSPTNVLKRTGLNITTRMVLKVPVWVLLCPSGSSRVKIVSGSWLRMAFYSVAPSLLLLYVSLSTWRVCPHLIAWQGRWWFGSRQKTKDGVHAQSAAAFFKTLKEESSIDEVAGTLGKAYKWELASKTKASAEIDKLEAQIVESLGAKWSDVKKLLKDYDGQIHESRRAALILLYAHLLRLDIKDAALRHREWYFLKYVVLC